MYEDFTLLIDGKNAFSRIIKEIDSAKESIKINMFIWRDDKIGNQLAQAVLNAANRGVKVEIYKDRYGVVLEKAEESKRSFFHVEQTFIETIKSVALSTFYPMENSLKRVKDTYSDLYYQIMNHENIKVVKDEFRADHSKYYIIDDKLILGGINIEDKENDKDLQGRVYQDYMIMLDGKQYVKEFNKKMNLESNNLNDYFFGVNIKDKDKNKVLFEMHDLYLDMIRNAKKNLMITMAYFSPLDDFIQEIVKAYQRGVHISIMIPKNANFQDDTNKASVKKIMKMTNNGIDLYFSNKMVHTKMIINDEYISFGSTNITKKAFNQLSELNIFLKNDDSLLCNVLKSNVKQNYKLSKQIYNYKDIKYNKIKSKIESVLI